MRNRRILEEVGVELLLVTEYFDGTYDGDLMFTMKGGISTWEKDRIKERMLGGRIRNLTEKGYATVAQLPYGRYYEEIKEGKNKGKRDYGKGILLDEEKADKVRQAARDYLAGKPIKRIGEEIGLHPRRLNNILRDQCGGNGLSGSRPSVRSRI